MERTDMTTDCPWCAGPATIDPALAEVRCDDCQVVVELSADPIPVGMPARRLDAAA
jgi:hypothetical protein